MDSRARSSEGARAKAVTEGATDVIAATSPLAVIFVWPA
jgi:hypothetical protein